MHRTLRPYEDLISWLKYFDIEYLDDELGAELAELDINDSGDLLRAIRIAIEPEFRSLNEVSRKSMRAVLNRALAASEEELEYVFSRVGMPFKKEVQSRGKLLQSISQVLLDAGA